MRRRSAHNLFTASRLLLPRRLVHQEPDYYNLKGLNDRLKPRTTVTLIPGDGIGPEMSQAAIGVMNAAKVPIDWEIFADITDITKEFSVITSIARNQTCLKGGPWSTDKDDENTKSNNVALRQALNLYCNVVPIKNIPGVKTKHENIDIGVVRENTEAEYSGLEQEVAPGVVQSLKVVTRKASLRIAEQPLPMLCSTTGKRLLRFTRQIFRSLQMVCSSRAVVKYPSGTPTLNTVK